MYSNCSETADSVLLITADLAHFVDVVTHLFSAKYVDTQLKSGNKEWSDEELDRQLDRVMVLFRYIHGE